MHPPFGKRLSKAQKGFSLIELMVAVVLLVVLLGVGVPSFRSIRENGMITAASNDMVTVLQFARNEAIYSGANVTVCPSNDQTTCSGTWSNGWIALRAGGGVARVWPAPPVALGIVLNDQAGVNPAAPNSVVYGPLGNATVGRCFRVTLNALQRFIGVNATGRTASSRVACPP